MALTKIDDRGLTTPIDLLDNEQIRFGTGSDLYIYHDGTYSYLKNTPAGGLYLASPITAITNLAVTENIARFNADGAVNLYYDGSLKLATSADGTSLTGNATVAGVVAPSANATYNLGYNSQRWNDIYMKNDMFINDDGRICWGDGNDLQIYHSGVDSVIDKTTSDGNLLIYVANDFYLKHGTEVMLAAKDDGAVELYHNGTKRFETTSTGFGGLGMLNAGPTSNNGYTYHDIRNSTDDQWLAALRHTTGTSPYGIWIGYTDASPDQNGNEFCRFDDSTAQRFRVNSDGDIYTHDSGNINSDQTMKENIVDASPKLDDLMKLKVRNFTWKKEFHPAKEGQKKIGFIAQEVEEVFPKLVTENNIAPLGKPDVIKKEIKQAWAPILVKALQEAVTKIETLETEVAALKAK